jgi:hypothetical protein
MKKSLILLLYIIVMAACGTKPAKESAPEEVSPTLLEGAKVHVVYFHGPQRCKTCLAIQRVASELVASEYADNPEVKFSEIDFSLAENDALAEQYEIAWSSLILVSGDQHVDLTDQAFANAVKNPDALRKIINEEIANLFNQTTETL